jgi:hypothetical protein
MIEESHREAAFCRAISGTPASLWLCTYATDRMTEVQAFDNELLLQGCKVEKVKALLEQHNMKLPYCSLKEALKNEFPLANQHGYNPQCALNRENPTHAYFIEREVVDGQYKDCLGTLKMERNDTRKRIWQCSQTAGKKLIPQLNQVKMNFAELFALVSIATWKSELPICCFRTHFKNAFVSLVSLN